MLSLSFLQSLCQYWARITLTRGLKPIAPFLLDYAGMYDFHFQGFHPTSPEQQNVPLERTRTK